MRVPCRLALLIGLAASGCAHQRAATGPLELEPDESAIAVAMLSRVLERRVGETVCLAFRATFRTGAVKDERPPPIDAPRSLLLDLRQLDATFHPFSACTWRAGRIFAPAGRSATYYSIDLIERPSPNSATVYWHWYFDGLAGAGFRFALEKHGAEWNVIDEAMLWES